MARTSRFLVPMVAVCIGAFVVAACGGSSSKSSAPTTTVATTTTAASTTKAASEKATTTTAAAAKSALAGVACPPAGATKSGTTPLSSGGTQTDYTTSAPYRDVLSACTSALQSAGWAVRGGGSGGWGNDGGGGLGATKGAANVQVQVGSNGGPTYVNVCEWPGPTSNDQCGDRDNDGRNDNDDN